MAGNSDHTRKAIVDAAYVLFRRHGFARVSLDQIAAGANVTKRTLYNHFDSKDALLEDVLELQHRLATAAFETIVSNPTGGPETVIEALFDDLEVWAEKPGWAGSGFTRLAMELADLRGHPARRLAHQHKAVIEAGLERLLMDGGVKSAPNLAREIMLLMEGAMCLILVHGDRSYATAAAAAAKKMLAHPAEP